MKKNKGLEANDRRIAKERDSSSETSFASRELGKMNKSSGAGKGDRNSAAWINSPKYQRSMAANDAYAAGEITLEEWRAIVHPPKEN